MAIKTVTEQLYDQIRHDILYHEIPAGEKLTIKMLNEKYKVSSSPIREALARLQQDGIIDYKPNVGMSVVQFTERDVYEIFEILEEFDVIALRLALKKDRDMLIHRLSSNIKKEEAFIDEDLWNDLSDEFHLIILEEANNSRLIEAASKIRTQLTIFSSIYEKEHSNRSNILEEHQQILGAIKNETDDIAECKLRNHLASSYHKALEVL